MSSQNIFHILTLHLYQPPGILQQLLQENEQELQSILKSYERIARHAHKYSDVAQLHVVFSVPLLQQLNDAAFIKETRHLVDVPAMLECFRSAANIEFIASGFQHAPLPLIPKQDWDIQLRSERNIIEASFGHQAKGYFSPGGLFTQEMISYLIEAGYQFALLPRRALLNMDGKPVDPYRAYQLDNNFIVFAIDEGFSYAQEHFVEAHWFADEVLNGTGLAPESDSPYVVTSCSDGENGNWFRRSDEENGFFGHFFAPYMEFCETGEFPIRPVNIFKYLQRAKPEPAQLADPSGTVACSTVDSHPVLKQLGKISERYWQQIKKGVKLDPALQELILQAEGSCYVLDHDPQYKQLAALLGRVEEMLQSAQKKRRKTTESTIAAQADVPAEAKQSSAKGAGKQVEKRAARTADKTTSKPAGKKKPAKKSPVPAKAKAKKAAPSTTRAKAQTAESPSAPPPAKRSKASEAAQPKDKPVRSSNKVSKKTSK